jgi:aspartate-semialdehyde dehydrogenase
MQPCHVAIIGAGSAVGREILQVFEERVFPAEKLSLLDTGEAEGARQTFRDHHVVVRPLTKDALEGVDLAVFAAGAEQSRDYAPQAVRAGAVVIDCSGAFSLDPQVPLCVPEVNQDVLRQHRGMVAVPHSATVQTVLALAPLHAAASLKRVVVSAYQSISGMGEGAMREFDQQMRDLLNFRPPEMDAFPHQLAFNCVPQCGQFLDNGYTSDEMALIEETRKLLGVAELPITATAVRVPLMHGHAVAITLETDRPLSPDAARDLLQAAAGVVVQDDVTQLYYPLPVRANGQDDAFVGRIRADASVPYGLHLWVVADNLRRGVALNVVQVAALLMA